MSDDHIAPSDVQRLLLTVLGAAWLLAFVYSFVTFIPGPDETRSLDSGLRRVETFLGWQGVAFLFAIAIFGVSRAWPRDSAIRRLGLLPLGCAGLLLLGLIGVVIWSI